MVEETLKTLLRTVCSRTYPIVLPQDPTYPNVVYQKITGGRGQAMDGPSGLASPLFQISIYASTFSEAKELAEDVRQLLDGYSGDDIQVAFVENDYDTHDELAEGYYRATMDVRIYCTEE
jgi:hypothetical protein